MKKGPMMPEKVVPILFPTKLHTFCGEGGVLLSWAQPCSRAPPRHASGAAGMLSSLAADSCPRALAQHPSNPVSASFPGERPLPALPGLGATRRGSRGRTRHARWTLT